MWRGSVQGRDSIDVSISCLIGIGFRGAAPLTKRLVESLEPHERPTQAHGEVQRFAECGDRGTYHALAVSPKPVLAAKPKTKEEAVRQGTWIECFAGCA